MRIAQVATAATPVRRVGADSIETLVWLLARELTRLGHEVTTFAVDGSEVDGELVTTLPGPYARGGAPGDWQLCEWLTLTRAAAESDRFDVVHSHNYLWGLPLGAQFTCPLVHTLHVSPYEDHAYLCRRFPEACITAISRFQFSAFPDVRPAAVIEHGIDTAQFPFRAHPEDYLLYLGRFTPGKGPLKAIRAARILGRRLLLAGPRNDYFTAEVEPHVDGKLIEYAGPVQGEARSALLGGAQALVYPVQAPEPFGLVMVEAMMCGTPPAAVAIGAVPEIVQDGQTGATCNDCTGMPQAILRATGLDRREVRARALRRFCASRMAREYADLYAGVAAGAAQPARAEP